ncbi:MAG: hypothetical protein ACI376_08160 [Candidatus Bruticola sp.]
MLVLLFIPVSAWAGKPTISGTIKSYNPGGRRLQLQRDDGVVKTIIMRPGCQFMVNGNKTSCNSFRPQMRVCVRICGSVVGDPLECDLIADYMSSKNVVARHAGTPNPTTVGGFAGTAGPAATLTSVFSNANNATPNVMGPLGIGGNFPGSNNTAAPTAGNPALAAQGAIPATQTSPQNNPGAPNQNPLIGGANPYANNPYSLGNQAEFNSTAALISGSDDKDKDEKNNFMPAPGGPFSMQLVNFNGRVMNADARTRSLTIMPDGQSQPIQVTIHQMISPVNTSGQNVDIANIQPGMAVSVQGMANTAGIIEARKVVVAF